MVVEFNRDLGFQNIMMEGDVLEIVHALQRDGNYRSTYGHSMNDARILVNIFQYGL
jgi:hypothetical protein